eukprot:gene17142-16961_t
MDGAADWCDGSDDGAEDGGALGADDGAATLGAGEGGAEMLVMDEFGGKGTFRTYCKYSAESIPVPKFANPKSHPKGTGHKLHVKGGKLPAHHKHH